MAAFRGVQRQRSLISRLHLRYDGIDAIVRLAGFTQIRLAATGRAIIRQSHHIEVHADTILGWIDDKRDLTLAEIRDRLAQEGHHVSITAIWRLLKRHDYTVKKKTAHADEQEREDVKAARYAWFEGQDDLDPARLFFLPGCSFCLAVLSG